MARFDEDWLDRLKTEISLKRLVESSGVVLKRHGKDLVGHCPFHDDKTPSLVVTPSSNLWHCLGACNTGGSVIDWVMKSQGVSFRHAVELLRHDLTCPNASSSLAAASSPVKNATVPKLPVPVSLDADDQLLLNQVVDFYHTTLQASPEAQVYLEKRGLADPELIDTFKLGFANRTLGLRLPHKNRKPGKAIREQLQRIGLYRDTGREHFAGSLVIPVLDADSNVMEVYGRKLNDNLRKGTPKHTYLPGPHRGVFNSECLAHTDELILCESLIDALTLWRWGYRHVTSSFGVNGLTEEMMDAFVDHGIQRVLIAYDRDDAGDKAAASAAELLQEQSVACYRLLFPLNQDVNSFACEASDPQSALADVIRKAVWLSEGDAEATSVVNLDASPLPTGPLSDVKFNERDGDLWLTLGEDNQARCYRVRGLDTSRDDQLRVQLLVKWATESSALAADAFHLDRLDLASSKQRQVFINQASAELGLSDKVIKGDLGKVLLTLETYVSEQQCPADDKATAVTLTSTEREAALALLQDPNLMDRVVSDLNRIGVVGETSNQLVGYLAGVSRLLSRPLAVLIQSSSAAGKSALMDSILSMMPTEARVQYSAMTGQSVFYLGETDLAHKILAISEEAGVRQASYALKLLQSEGEVSIASTGKDENTGQLVTREYRVTGPVMLFLTTTAIDIEEELLNRCLVLTVNEGREQTQAIHQAQRTSRTLTGLTANLSRDNTVTVHQHAQRLLRPLAVVNPYADQLTFLDDQTRTRRDHDKYLTLIDSIALLHQYQREVKTVKQGDIEIEYIEVALADIELANDLARDILGKTLDELPPQTRRLLTLIGDMVKDRCQHDGIDQRDLRFSRKDIRACCHWGETQVRVHTRRLVDMEYLLVHRGGRGQSFEYEFLYQDEGDAGEKFVMGLTDIAQLQATTPATTTTTSRGETPEFAGPTRGDRGGIADLENRWGTTKHTASDKSSRPAAKRIVQG